MVGELLLLGPDMLKGECPDEERHLGPPQWVDVLWRLIQIYPSDFIYLIKENRR